MNKKSNKTTYLTKRSIVRASGKAVRQASQRAMKVAGYVVVEKDGWVVRKNRDGSLERISKLSPKVKPQDVILD